MSASTPYDDRGARRTHAAPAMPPRDRRAASRRAPPSPPARPWAQQRRGWVRGAGWARQRVGQRVFARRRQAGRARSRVRCVGGFGGGPGTWWRSVRLGIRGLPVYRPIPCPESAMWVIFLEAALALVLLFVIVWASRPRRRPDEAAEPENELDKHS